MGVVNLPHATKVKKKAEKKLKPLIDEKRETPYSVLPP